ncbi:calcium/sodium antiporter [Ectothiorhodospiraceae bacterium WFHF3C12]|nr:calcium/sodium antiporter [Ectothiorhodospiraceae bacterium WFHF3C12]
MGLYLLTLVLGFIVLTWSADRFIAGAAVTARSLGVSPLVVGLTIVGIGTSAPEMLVSGLAAWEGNPGLGIGNAIGSNIANTGLIIGITALCFPLAVRSSILKREMPVLLAVMGLSLPLLLDLRLQRWEGLLLLLGMGAVLLWMGWQARRGGADPIVQEYEEEIPTDMPLRTAVFWLIAGLALLLASSRALVWAAVATAQSLGISDLVIGLTIVALGTSLPELAASMASARKGEHDIAIGNVIGSNIFNILGVMGLAGAVAPFHFDAEVLNRDFVSMVLLTMVFFAFAYGLRRPGHVTRPEGLLLLAAYCGYQVMLFFDAHGSI